MRTRIGRTTTVKNYKSPARSIDALALSGHVFKVGPILEDKLVRRIPVVEE